MFRTLIYPSSGACNCAVELPHRSFCSRFVVCWRFGAAGFEWCPCCRLQPATRTPLNPKNRTKASGNLHNDLSTFIGEVTTIEPKRTKQHLMIEHGGFLIVLLEYGETLQRVV